MAQFSSKVIMGIDILQMSPASKQKPKYAALIFSNDAILFKNEEISFRKLIKILSQFKPNFLAIDNVWELAPTQEALQELMEKFPPETTLVQTTGAPGQMQPIHHLAKRCGIQLTSHPNPLKTAEICARLVQIGIGHEVALFEKESQIQVTRVRTIGGPGGWSQNRYRRNSQMFILQATREIQTQLDELGIEYDLSVRKTDYGLDRSVFTVYAAIYELLPKIKSYKGSTIRVKITPIKRKELEFIPLVQQEELGSAPLKSLIVGIDPGTTTGIAILDLNGKILALHSGKDISRRDLVKFISQFGSAVMCCCDVTPLPKYVEKVSNTYNSIIFRPSKSMKVADKKELVTEYLKDSEEFRKVSDAHIRDALASAVKAYLPYKNVFEKIHKRVREMNVDIPEEKVKVLVLRGYSIYDAISILTFKPEDKEEAVETESQASNGDQITELNNRIYQLIDKNIELKRSLEELKDKNTQIKEELELQKMQLSKSQKTLESERSRSLYQLRGERLIRAQDIEIKYLRATLDQLKDQISELEEEISKYGNREIILNELQRQELANEIIILKVIETFSKENLEKVEFSANNVLYMIDGSGGGSTTAIQLISAAKDLRAIITNTLSHEAYQQFRSAGIPIIPTEEIQGDLKAKEGVFFINKHRFEQKLKQYKQKQHEMNRQEAEIWLQNLITDYRKRKDEE